MSVWSSQTLSSRLPSTATKFVRFAEQLNALGIDPEILD